MLTMGQTLLSHKTPYIAKFVAIQMILSDYIEKKDKLTSLLVSNLLYPCQLPK